MIIKEFLARGYIKPCGARVAKTTFQVHTLNVSSVGILHWSHLPSNLIKTKWILLNNEQYLIRLYIVHGFYNQIKKKLIFNTTCKCKQVWSLNS